MKLRSTANAVYETAYHMVWSTKYRRKVLCGEVEAAFKGEVALICAERGWQLHALEVMPDHVHLFVGLPPAVSAAQAAHVLKGRSARVLRARFHHLYRCPHRSCLWNPSYYVGTAGGATAAAIEKYIAGQKTAAH